MQIFPTMVPFVSVPLNPPAYAPAHKLILWDIHKHDQYVLCDLYVTIGEILRFPPKPQIV